jgi:glycosyltransferase involved in cell wall biosynthesis
MKIFLDSKMHIMIQRLIPIWKEMGHDISQDPKGCDVQLSLVSIKQNSGLPIVTRLDGIYYDKAIAFTKKNLPISKAHVISKGLIYQSNLSKNMCEKYLAEKTTSNFDIIYNGIQNKWCGEFEKHEGINIITSAKWRRWKRLEEIISIFLEFNKYVPNSKLHIFGKLHNNKIIDNKNLIYYGMTKFKDMSKIYKIGDMFIHLAKNDPCPKTVVEAIGAGIPVVTSLACGGATEMSLMTKGCIICKGDKINTDPDYVYQDNWNYVSDELRSRMIKSMILISKDKRRVELPYELNVKNTAIKYLKVMENCNEIYRKENR